MYTPQTLINGRFYPVLRTIICVFFSGIICLCACLWFYVCVCVYACFSGGRLMRIYVFMRVPVCFVGWHHICICVCFVGSCICVCACFHIRICACFSYEAKCCAICALAYVRYMLSCESTQCMQEHFFKIWYYINKCFDWWRAYCIQLFLLMWGLNVIFFLCR